MNEPVCLDCGESHAPGCGPRVTSVSLYRSDSGDTPEIVKPLHVQVAEALGWTCVSLLSGSVEDWSGYAPDAHEFVMPIPRFDTDWSATGPLIEKYGLLVAPYGPKWNAVYLRDSTQWGPMERAGATPKEAVCRLILALKAAGKLHD